MMLVCECGLCVAMHMWKSEDNPGVSPHLLPRLRHGFLLFLHCVEQVRWPMYELLEILWSLPSISQEEHWDQRERRVTALAFCGFHSSPEMTIQTQYTANTKSLFKPAVATVKWWWVGWEGNLGMALNVQNLRNQVLASPHSYPAVTGGFAKANSLKLCKSKQFETNSFNRS